MTEVVEAEQVTPDLPISPELQALLNEHEQLSREIEGRKKLRGINFYVPNMYQYKAHCSTAKQRLVVKGNRAGGSTWGAAEIAMHLTKKYPEWYPKENRFRGSLKIRIATDKFFKIDTVIEPKLRQFIPWKEVILKERRGPQGYLQKLNCKDGSFIEFLSSEQDQMAWEGQDIDFFWGDEPMKRSHWIATKRGLLDRGGRAIFSFTPLIEPWMKADLVDKADGKNIDVFYANTRDNCFDIKGNPILSEQDIRDFENMLTDEERETRIEGKFFHLRGVVYKELSATIHLINDFNYSRDFAGYPVICVLDPHDRLPHWVLWAMVDRINDVYVMYEMVKEGTYAELAAGILATEKYFGWNVVKRYIDPNFGRKPSASSGMSTIDELAKYRAVFTEALSDNIELGHLRVKEYLRFNHNKPLDINNKPKLYFVKGSVMRTWNSMLNYQHDEWKGTQDRDPKEEVKPKDAHGADCVRYLIVSQPSFTNAYSYEPHRNEIYY